MKAFSLEVAMAPPKTAARLPAPLQDTPAETPKGRKARLATSAALPSPSPPGLVSAVLGDAASPEAIARLNRAIEDLKLLKTQALLPILQQAVDAVRADQPQKGAEFALKALEVDEECGVAWHVLAVCREKSDDFTTALKCYETALQFCPDEPEIANDLGRLSYRMGFFDVAEKLFELYLQSNPGSADGINNLANAQRDQFRFAEAIETLRPAIGREPTNALLWNTLGTVMAEQGDMERATLFFAEALTHAPDLAKARYNQANALWALGDPQTGVTECETAIAGTVLESELSMMKLARSTMLIASGDLERGWPAYEARLEPHYADVTHFMIDRPRWTPEMDIRGKQILLFGEQGLGDEVLFASTLPDMIEAVGPEGTVSVAIEPRLVDLFRRSFPQAEIGAHGTLRIDHYTVRAARFLETCNHIDAWAPLAAPLQRFRRKVADFPERRAFLTPAPDRVEHWRGVLAEGGDAPTVGILWKSMVKATNRARYFSAFEQWEPILRTPGLRFVNIQYGDSAEEMAFAKDAFGVDIWTPPGLDLKNDLDDLTALTVALDLVLGPANATTNLAAAAGAEVWLIAAPGAWPMLGTDRYPWYPQARVFTPPAYNTWPVVIGEVAGALAERIVPRA